MSFKDLIKDVGNFAQEGIDSIQEEIALKKEEQQRLREEMNRRISCYREEIMENLLINPKDKPLIIDDASVILSFTESFYYNLYLPASNASNSHLSFYPEYDKNIKDFSKTFSNFSKDEHFLMGYRDLNEEILLLSTDNLYFKIIFPENNAFYCLGQLPLKDLYSFNIQENEHYIIFSVNDLALISIVKKELPYIDLICLKEYLIRLKNRNFDISPDQVDQLILSKLNSSTIEILKKHLKADENLLYFAWGLDSINSNKFVACTNKKVFLYDKEINLCKSFYYQEITAITTKPSSINIMDISLSIGINPNDLIIKTKDEIEVISILYSKEAQRVIEIYQKFTKELPKKTNSNKQEDPIELLEKLAKLRQEGILTEEEFKTKKEDILSRL